MMRQSLRLLAASCAVVALAACGGRDEPESRELQAEEPAAVQPIRPIEAEEEDQDAVDEAPTEADRGAPPETGSETTFDTGLDLPAAFPNDILLPQEWTVIGTTPIPDGFSVQAMSENGVGEVADRLRTAMEGQGWTATDAGTLSEQVSQLGFEKGDRVADFNIIDSGGKATVQLVTRAKADQERAP